MVRKIARTAIALIIAMAVCLLIATIAGATLSVEGDWNLPQPLQYAVQTAFFILTITLMFLYVFDVSDKRVKRLVLSYPVFHIASLIVTNIFFNYYIIGLLLAYIFPTLSIIIMSIIIKDVKRSLLRYAVMTVLMFPFMLILIEVKSDWSYSLYFDGEFRQGFYMAIDMVVYQIAMIFAGGASYGRAMEFFHIPYRGSVRGNSAKDNQLRKTFRFNHKGVIPYLRTKPWKTERFWLLVVMWLIQFAQLGIIFVICWLGEVLIEGLVIYSSFFIFGLIVKKRWHSQSVVVCTGLGAAVFFGLARLMPDVSLLWTFPIIGGLAITITFYYVQCHVETISEKQAEAKKAIEELNRLKDNYEMCGKERFIEHCKLAGIKDDKIEFIWDTLREKMSEKEASTKHKIRLPNVGQTKKRLLERLQKYEMSRYDS